MSMEAVTSTLDETIESGVTDGGGNKEQSSSNSLEKLSGKPYGLPFLFFRNVNQAEKLVLITCFENLIFLQLDYTAKLESIPAFNSNSLCSCLSDIEQSRNSSDVMYESYDIESVFIPPPMDESMETPSKKFKSEQFLDNYGSFLTGMRYCAPGLVTAPHPHPRE